MNWRPNKGSIFMFVILVIALLAVLGYFGINVNRDVVQNPNVQSNFSYVWGNLQDLWNNYFKQPAKIVWNWALINVINLPVKTGNNGINIPGVNMPQFGGAQGIQDQNASSTNNQDVSGLITQ